MSPELATLRPEMSLLEATKAIVARHYPAYPVVDAAGKLIGMIRARTIFEQEAFEISAQAGKMVGVEAEERVSTSWLRSFRFRHPWLQLNLLTAFLAAGVVGYYQDAIDKIVLLAVFLPVLAGQSGNTGCQALAVTLRGMTLGELKPGGTPAAVASCAARVGIAASVPGVITTPGTTALTRMLRLAYSSAAALVRPTTPCLLAV